FTRSNFSSYSPYPYFQALGGLATAGAVAACGFAPSDATSRTYATARSTCRALGSRWYAMRYSARTRRAASSFSFVTSARAASAQHRNAPRLKIQPRPAHPPEQPVLRVDLHARLIVRADLAVRCRVHHQAVHRLDRPSIFDEADREAIEKLRMARRLAPRAE